jgi:hypothetical protein
MPDQSQIPERRDATARACRILAMEGVVEPSARASDQARRSVPGARVPGPVPAAFTLLVWLISGSARPRGRTGR